MANVVYYISFKYPDAPGQGITVTNTYPGGITITGVPLGMEYKVAMYGDGWPRCDDSFPVPSSGTVVVGDGLNKLTFQKNTVYYASSGESSDSDRSDE